VYGCLEEHRPRRVEALSSARGRVENVVEHQAEVVREGFVGGDGGRVVNEVEVGCQLATAEVWTVEALALGGAVANEVEVFAQVVPRRNGLGCQANLGRDDVLDISQGQHASLRRVCGPA